MAAVALPSLGVPLWAREISEDQWKDMVQNTLQNRQSAAALRLARTNRTLNASAPPTSDPEGIGSSHLGP